MLNLSKARSLLASFKKSFQKNLWVLPDVSALTNSESNDDEYEVPISIEMSVEILSRYGLRCSFEDYFVGPSVTTFIYRVPAGSKLGSINKYESDISRDLGVKAIRFVPANDHPSCIGIEVENITKFPVNFKDMVIDSMDDKYAVPLGSDSYGASHLIDIREQPHCLVAGQTGSGKSVFLNTTISSLISKCLPSELKLLLIDPKQVEFSQYENIPHLMEPIAVDLEEAYNVVDVAVDEMERRFSLLREYKVKKIEDYNEVSNNKLPYIVIIVDEFADLMMMGAPKERREVEGKIVRIAQKARAVGIHLILATQKPLATVVTSLIKANMPAQVAFKVQKSIDSKVILDETGAENLAGKGDMLFTGILSSGKSVQLHRVQAPYIKDLDIEYLVNGGLND